MKTLKKIALPMRYYDFSMKKLTNNQLVYINKKR